MHQNENVIEQNYVEILHISFCFQIQRLVILLNLSLIHI